ASIAIINAFVNASPQNEYASRNGQNPSETDAFYINNNARDRPHQLSNFGNGNYKHNVINVDQTSNGFSVSSYEADRNIRPTSTSYNVNLNSPARTTVTSNGMGWDGTNGMDRRNAFSINDNRQEPQRPQSRFYQNGENSRGSIDRQQILKEILDKANIGTGNNNDNQIQIDGVRINVNPNPADHHGRGAGFRTGNPLVGNTQYLYNSRNGEENIVRPLTNRMGGGSYNVDNRGQNGNNANNYHAGAQNVPDDIIRNLYDSTQFVYNYGNGLNNKNIIQIDNVRNTQDRGRLNNRPRGKPLVENNNRCTNIYNDETLKVLPLNPNIL
ncbi:hypothetical protein KGM_216001B, partial [Danaus plexippus plexippus]